MKKKRLNNNIKILINASAVVLVWRGLWILFDLYVFPDNILASSLVSIVIGLTILLYKDRIITELK